MNTDLQKHAPPLPFVLPDGTLIRLAPLSRRRLDELELMLSLELRALHCEPMMREQLPLRVLELASGCELGDLLHQEEVEALFKLWAWWQERCNETRRLDGWLARRTYDDPDYIRDGHAAHRAKSAAEYYGRAEVDLTDGQVAYWQLLAGGFAKWHGPSNGPRKVPTKQWLNSDDLD